MRNAMSAIAATGSSSAYNALAQLLGYGASSATPGIPQIGQATVPASSATSTSNPIDSLNLSDNAKAILARAQTDQVAADKLAAFLQSARNPSGAGNAPASKPTSTDVTQLFDQLTGRTQSQQLGSTPASAGDFETATLTALTEAARRPDGSVGNYSKQVSDVLTPISTPQQINDWYKTSEPGAVIAAQNSPSEGSISLAQAIQNRQVTFQNAADIPGLNFHNTYTFQGGEGGGSGNVTFTYNQNAAIFQDPTNNYLVSSDGTVISWAKTPASGATPSA
jgi:hypothetical protein